VTRETAVVRAGLAVVQVHLETEHGLRPADRELEVGTKTHSRVPLTVVVTAEVAVEEVSTSGSDLVEEPRDRHSGRGYLREHRRPLEGDGGQDEYCGDKASPHTASSSEGQTPPATR